MHFLEEGAKVCVDLGGQPRTEHVEHGLAAMDFPALDGKLNKGRIIAVFAILKQPTELLAKRVANKLGLGERPCRCANPGLR